MAFEKVGNIVSGDGQVEEAAARVIVQSPKALGLIHADFDTARRMGCSPHQAIDHAMQKLGKMK